MPLKIIFQRRKSSGGFAESTVYRPSIALSTVRTKSPHNATGYNISRNSACIHYIEKSPMRRKDEPTESFYRYRLHSNVRAPSALHGHSVFYEVAPRIQHAIGCCSSKTLLDVQGSYVHSKTRINQSYAEMATQRSANLTHSIILLTLCLR